MLYGIFVIKIVGLKEFIPTTLTGVHVVGRAVTVKYLPFRKTVDEGYSRQKYLALTKC